MYNRKGKEPPCDSCKPEVFKKNIDAIKIFRLTKNQLIMSASGPIEVSHEAIHRALELYEVRDKLECFSKVLSMSREWVERLKETA